jgi:branched-subunit amino acid transport protein
MIGLMIFLMAAIVFGSRYLFLEPKLPVRLNTKIQKFLSYSAPAVLTAILAPIVFINDTELNLSIENSYLVCALVAVFLAILTKNTLLTTILSMGLFFIIH